MPVAVTMAASEGSHAIICASTGNTSASAAAYAARGGLSAFVVIPEGKIALGKLAQAMMHGARVIQIEGNFDTGMSIVKNMAETAPVTLVNSVNPYRLHGQKTAAFELIDALGRAPDKLLFDAYAQHGTISHDGNKLLFVREGKNMLYRKGYRGPKASQIWLYDRKTKKFDPILQEETGSRSAASRNRPHAPSAPEPSRSTGPRCLGRNVASGR